MSMHTEAHVQQRIAEIKAMNAACVPPLIVSDAFVEAMARGIVMHFPLSEEIKRAEQQLNHSDPLMVTQARNRIVRAAEHVADLELQMRRRLEDDARRDGFLTPRPGRNP